MIIAPTTQGARRENCCIRITSCARTSQTFCFIPAGEENENLKTGAIPGAFRGTLRVDSKATIHHRPRSPGSGGLRRPFDVDARPRGQARQTYPTARHANAATLTRVHPHTGMRRRLSVLEIVSHRPRSSPACHSNCTFILYHSYPWDPDPCTAFFLTPPSPTRRLVRSCIRFDVRDGSVSLVQEIPARPRAANRRHHRVCVASLCIISCFCSVVPIELCRPP
jgi:hypothetical protein